ncbi:4'-phosphopantetheinyl transferase superfamily protein [Rothia nasimurium]|uniref:4'-phosphopantetheinyl transferase superfamily protein n=1 Tax=Rothia nasimurium TaxID=85336 RepID=UPI003BA207E7
MSYPAADSTQPVAPLTLLALPALALRTGHGVSWLAYVGLAEQMRAAEFNNPEDALAFAAQHTLMRCMAATLLEVKPTAASEIPVDRSCPLCSSNQPHGRPRIKGTNLSMARSLGLAVGLSAPVGIAAGVDVVRLRGSYYDSFDGLSLTPTEKQRITALPGESADFARHLLWSAKEAVLKATGFGLGIPPRSVEIDLDHFPLSAPTVGDGLLSARAQLTLPEGTGAQVPLEFWVSWTVYEGQYVLAVASSSPHHLNLQTVQTPLAVKRAFGR